MNTPVRKIVAWARADWARGTTEPVAKPAGGPTPRPMADQRLSPHRARHWDLTPETRREDVGDLGWLAMCAVQALCIAFWALVAAVAVALVIGLPMALWQGPMDSYGPGTGDTAPHQLCTDYWLSTHNGTC